MGKRIEPYGKLWMKRANDLAMSFVPKIYPCKDCKNPVIDGFCCTFCNGIDPGDSNDWEDI